MLQTRSVSHPVGSARAWLLDHNVEDERLPLTNAKRVVVKVGTAVVSNPDGTLALSRLGALVEQIKDLKDSGRQVLLVSSGAVGLGRLRLGLSRDVVANPANVIDRQACAAAGQGILMSTYDMMFQRMGISAAQVLITQGDFLSRERYSYLTDTLDRLTSLGAIPIINENDVVTGCSELDTMRVFSDNDKLSALVAAGADADGLALLTDVDAVFTKPPDEPGAERIRVFTANSHLEIGEKSTMGRGGMSSKIAAARVAALGGVQTVIASGYDLNNITNIFQGKDVGTLFLAAPRPNKRQRWLTFATTTQGKVMVSGSSKERLLDPQASNRSLLASDILSVEGGFPQQSVVELADENGNTFARGMMQMSADTCRESLSAGAVTFNSSRPAMNPHDYVILESF